MKIEQILLWFEREIRTFMLNKLFPDNFYDFVFLCFAIFQILIFTHEQWKFTQIFLISVKIWRIFSPRGKKNREFYEPNF